MLITPRIIQRQKLPCDFCAFLQVKPQPGNVRVFYYALGFVRILYECAAHAEATIAKCICFISRRPTISAAQANAQISHSFCFGRVAGC